jgi:hypothetical protein
MPSEGDRVELVHTSDEYTNLSTGDRGTVTDVDVDRPPIVETPTRKWWVDWDDAGTLAMIQGQDRIKTIDEEEDA